MNGLEAVELLRARRSTVSLVLMDINMPVMDGLEATRRIRADEASGGLPRLPIVAMTADCMPEVVERCAAAGMDEVTFKPIAANKLEQIVRKHTKAHGRHRTQHAEQASAKLVTTVG